jgi:uncharacterized protein YbaR (Trm112 family)
MLHPKLLEILVCPKCKGDLEYDEKGLRLTCHSCRLIYAIKDVAGVEIPNMLIDEAERF